MERTTRAGRTQIGALRAGGRGMVAVLRDGGLAIMPATAHGGPCNSLTRRRGDNKRGTVLEPAVVVVSDGGQLG